METRKYHQHAGVKGSHPISSAHKDKSAQKAHDLEISGTETVVNVVAKIKESNKPKSKVPDDLAKQLHDLALGIVDLRKKKANGDLSVKPELKRISALVIVLRKQKKDLQNN